MDSTNQAQPDLAQHTPVQPKQESQPLPKKSPLVKWIIVCVLIVITCSTLVFGALFWNSTNYSNTPTSSNQPSSIPTTVSTSLPDFCPLAAGQFIGRVFSVQEPFIAELIDYSLESVETDQMSFNPQKYKFHQNSRPMLIDSNATVNTGIHTMQKQDIVRGEYSSGACDAGGELGFCSYIEIIDVLDSPDQFCNDTAVLVNIDREHPVFSVLTDYDESMQLSIRTDGTVHFTDYWGNNVQATDLDAALLNTLVSQAQSAIQSDYSDNSTNSSIHIFTSVENQEKYMTIPAEFEGHAPPEISAYATTLMNIIFDIVNNASYNLSIAESYPLIAWEEDISFSEFTSLTPESMAAIEEYTPGFIDQIAMHGGVFVKDADKMYKIYQSNFSREKHSMLFIGETDSGFVGYSNWQEHDMSLATVPDNGITISKDVVERNKIQLQSRTDRYIIDGNTVYVVTLRMQ